MIRAALTDLANTYREDGAIDESECYIDATFASAKGGREQIGPTRRGKGVKIMAIVDRHGLPLAVTTHAANIMRSRWYRAYDSDPLDEKLRKQGTEMIAPHKSNRVKRKTQDGRRWIVELFFAWTQWQRRLLVRWEFYPRKFLGFVQLSALCILLRQF